MTAFDRNQEGPALKKFIVECRGETFMELEVEAKTHEEALEQVRKKPARQVVKLEAVAVESEDGEAWHVTGACEACDRVLMRSVKTNEKNVDYGRDEDGNAVCQPCYGERPEAP